MVVLIIFLVILQTVTNATMLSIGRQGTVNHLNSNHLIATRSLHRSLRPTSWPLHDQDLVDLDVSVAVPYACDSDTVCRGVDAVEEDERAVIRRHSRSVRRAGGGSATAWLSAGAGSRADADRLPPSSSSAVEHVRRRQVTGRARHVALRSRRRYLQYREQRLGYSSHFNQSISQSINHLFDSGRGP